MSSLRHLVPRYLDRQCIPRELRGGSFESLSVGMVPFCLWCSMRYALCGLSKALAADLWSTNILVQEVILGEVSSTYWKNNPGSATRLPKIANMFKSMTEEKAARGVIYGIESGDSSYVYPYTIRALFAIHGWCPTPIDKLMRYTGWRVDPSRHIALPSDEFDNL
eukprot:gb/GECG01006291.1/.p1 GENE.gb/GECG01006291.1/~~gb/GECG01006291.1/.p1  ORF type:complete len:165 (+),score=7.57 gb/GECG01006291.1/:1-495(+)